LATTIERVEWDDPRAVALRAAMDAESGAVYLRRMARMSRDDRARMANALAVHGSDFAATIVLLDDGVPVGHGALRPFEDTFELKKIFVVEEARGRGFSRVLMEDLESTAKARGAARVILQTGDHQLAAIGLYESLGYVEIPPFGDYGVIPFGVCYEKGFD
jgi:GNAT superfamily N-acetyltransferase